MKAYLAVKLFLFGPIPDWLLKGPGRSAAAARGEDAREPRGAGGVAAEEGGAAAGARGGARDTAPGERAPRATEDRTCAGAGRSGEHTHTQLKVPNDCDNGHLHAMHLTHICTRIT